jgi:hypothetical protein
MYFKNKLSNSQLIIALFIVGFLFTSTNVWAAQDLSLSTIDSEAAKVGSTLTKILKIALSIVGGLGAIVSGYNVWAKGQNSWQYIGAFIISLALLAIGSVMFLS